VIDVVRRAMCFGQRAFRQVLLHNTPHCWLVGLLAVGSSVCEALETKTVSATCSDAEQRAHDVFGLLLAWLALSAPWRCHQVVWWWRAGAALNGVCGSHFSFETDRGPICRRQSEVRMCL
jgi:hypothetical protein